MADASPASKLPVPQLKYPMEMRQLMNIVYRKIESNFFQSQSETSSLIDMNTNLHVEILKMQRLSKHNQIKLEKFVRKKAAEEEEKESEMDESSNEKKREMKRKLQEKILGIKSSIKVLQFMFEAANISIGTEKDCSLENETGSLEPVLRIRLSSFLLGIAAATCFHCFRG